MTKLLLTKMLSMKEKKAQKKFGDGIYLCYEKMCDEKNVVMKTKITIKKNCDDKKQ